MDLDRELESGNPLQDPARGSFLQRLAAAASRAVAPCATNDPNPDPDPVASQPEKWDREKGDYTDAENDEACAKIWSVYVGEAERYDKALVEGWKADMEGMLIFSGLFSASLTAFLIESYKILRPDSGDLTVAAITQVSQQLAAIASNTTFVLQSPAFDPTTASLWCNALWFVSLSLSLTCALLATLVEQWAREFLHKTEMRPSPVRRARIFSFLYFGLKQFRMHTIVDVIPFLLHASLLLFFAGLIAFLLPVNYLMMYLMCIILAAVLLLYLVLTVLPVICLNCPYRTPLSAPLWSLLQSFSRFFNKPNLSPGQTITEAVVDSALQDTQSRDQQALKWTLDSLTDDTELLPFVEAIPDLVHGPNGFRRANDPLFDALLGTTEVASLLVTRICNLIASTRGMPLKDPLRIQRCTAGQRAIWALCMMPLSWDRYFDIDIVVDAAGGDLPPTAVLAIQYHAEKWFHHLLGMLYDLLTNHSHLSVYFLDEVLPTVRRLLQLALENENLIISPLSPLVSNVRLAHVAELKALYAKFTNSKPTSPQFERLQLIIEVLYHSHDWAYHSVLLVGHFISKGILPDDEPLFEPMWTCSTILSAIESDPPRERVKTRLFSFQQAIETLEFRRDNPSQPDVLACIAFRLSPFMTSGGLQTYLRYRKNNTAIQYALKHCDITKLAHGLGDSLSCQINEVDSQWRVDETICDINTVANCLDYHSVAIRFLDQIIAQGNSVPHPAIRAIQYFRCLQQAYGELGKIQSQAVPVSTMLPCLQEIYMKEPFHLLPPQFPLEDMEVERVISNMQTYIINKYILFLSDFFQNEIPASLKLSISPFTPHLVHRWERVDPEIQTSFFAAILAYIQSLVHITNPNSRLESAAVAGRLWSSGMFWLVFTIERTCLQLLMESLTLYHELAEENQIDTTSSKKLLVEVEKALVCQQLADLEDLVSDASTDARHEEDMGWDSEPRGSIQGSIIGENIDEALHVGSIAGELE